MKLVVECRHRFAGGFQMDFGFQSEASITALVGPSGSGKTTLLQVIAGLLRPEHGKVQLGGETVLDTTRGVFIPPEHRRTGFLFQDLCLFPHLSVRENIEFGARRRNNGDSGVTFPKVAETLELGGLLDRSPGTLSGGEQERVALARAILSGARILLLDEPLTSLDPPLRARVAEFIEIVAREFRLPVLMVSHDRALVERLADQIIDLEAN